MKRIIIAFVVLFTTINVLAQSGDEPLRFDRHSWKELAGSISSVSKEKVLDETGKTAPCIIIKIKNLSYDDAVQLRLKAYNGSGGTATLHDKSGVLRNTDEGVELVVWIGVAGNFDIFVRSADKTLVSDRLHISEDILYNKDKAGKNISGRIYEVTLEYVKKRPVEIRVHPVDLDVYIDNKKANNINGIHHIDSRAGKRNVLFRRNGTIVKDTTIEISSSGNNVFYIDLRKRYKVEISSIPQGAEVYLLLDGKEDSLLGYTTRPQKIWLPEGRHTIRRYLKQKNLTLSDTNTLYVTSNERENVLKKPLEQKRPVSFVGRYQGLAVPTHISIIRKGKNSGGYIPDPTEARVYHNLHLPNGTYKITLNDNTHTGSKDIEIESGGPSQYTIELKPSKQKFVWPWSRSFDHKPIGFSIGYIQREITLKVSDEAYKESIDPAWRNDDKYTYGIRIGLHGQPCLPWGLGIYTGGFFEYYYSPTPSSTKDHSSNAAMADNYTSFSEMSVFLPLHLYYRIPLSEQLAISLHGGIDAEWYFKATYKDSDQYYATVTPPYGISDADDFMYNWGFGIGTGIQYRRVLIEATWHTGITNHEIYTNRYSMDNLESHMSKFNISFSLLF